MIPATIALLGEHMADEQARRVEADVEARSLERLVDHPRWATTPLATRNAIMKAFASGHGCGVLLGIDLGMEQAAFALDALGEKNAAAKLLAMHRISRMEVLDGE